MEWGPGPVRSTEHTTMDTSYRMDCLRDRHPASDLEMTWLGGEPVHSNKIKPPPLNTTRLKPFRQVTRGAILSILETGHVSIEFLKRKGEQDRVTELFVVSGDGQEICVEQWRWDGPSMPDDRGDGGQTWKTFSLSVLPEKHWKKYSHACRFVDLVKSKTAKVTMYSDRAKGVLMENWPPSFEASFFNGGPKIVMCENEVHIKEDSGASLMFHRDSLNNLVNNYTLDLIQHATQIREQCLRLEASVMTVQAMSHNADHLFPVTVGVRPSTSFCSSTSSNSGSLDLLSSPRFSHLHSSPSGSQGHSSPPPSPVSQLDLRFQDTSRKSLPPATSHPSPSVDHTCPKTQESPFRHLSTLEGRKLRRHKLGSVDSSYLSEDNGQPRTTAPQSHPQSNSSGLALCLQPVSREATEAGQTGEVSSCHALANSQIFNPEMDLSQHFLSAAAGPPVPIQARTCVDQMLEGPSPSSQPLTGPSAAAAAAKPTKPATAAQDKAANEQLVAVRVDQTAINVSHNPPTKAATNAVQAEVAGVSLETSYTVGGVGSGGDCVRGAPPQCVPCVAPSSPARKVDSGELDQESSPVLRQAFVLYTGWATQLVNGTIWIRYNDGTQLGVNRNQTEVVYVDQESHRHRYQRADTIPEAVRQKLERLPSVINSLYTRPANSPYGLASA